VLYKQQQAAVCQKQNQVGTVDTLASRPQAPHAPRPCHVHKDSQQPIRLSSAAPALLLRAGSSGSTCSIGCRHSTDTELYPVPQRRKLVQEGSANEFKNEVNHLFLISAACLCVCVCVCLCVSVCICMCLCMSPLRR
jgi:hypothetical protein